MRDPGLCGVVLLLVVASCAHDEPKPGPDRAAEANPAPPDATEAKAREAGPHPARGPGDSPGPSEAGPAPTTPPASAPDTVTLTLESPVPDAPRGPHPTASPWSTEVKALAARLRGVEATAAMACTARDLGRAQLQIGRAPGYRLKRVVPARCGATVADVDIHAQAVTIDAALDDQGLVEGFARPLARLLDQVEAGPYDIGGALVRDGERSVVVLAVGLRRVRAADIDIDRTAGVLIARLTVEPSVAKAYLYEKVEPLITYGPFDARRCDLDVTQVLPAVAFVCPLDGDETSADVAYATVTAYPQGAFLGHHLTTLAAPGPAHDGAHFRLRAFDTEDAGAALLEVTNRARKSAGRGPLDALPASEGFVQEGKTLLQALRDPRPDAEKTAQSALLTLMRGPTAQRADVGFVGWATEHPDDNPGALVAAAFAFADTRAVLMSPLSRGFLVSPPLSIDEQTRGLVFGTYRLKDGSPDVQAVRDVIDERRAALGFGALLPFPAMDAVVSAAAVDVGRGFDPTEALRDRVVKAGLEKPVVAVVLDGPTLNTVKIVNELLTAEGQRLALAATYTDHGVVVVGVLQNRE